MDPTGFSGAIGGSFRVPVPTSKAAITPESLPKNVFTENGLLSTQDFLSWLEQQRLPADQAEDLLKWSFSRPKLPPTSLSDTMDFDPDFDFFAPPEYAVSPSEHLKNMPIDTLPQEIFPCEAVRYEGDLPVGISGGKAVLQQQSARGCVAACAAMLALDHSKSFNAQALCDINLGNSQELINLLHSSGLAAKVLQSIECDTPAKLQAQIKANGSLACGVNHPHLSGHEMVLDSIDEKTAVLRDPAYGYRLRVTTEAFFGMQPSEFVCITGDIAPSRGDNAAPFRFTRA